jgi:hypothetical protein
MSTSLLMLIAALQALPAPDAVRWEPLLAGAGNSAEIDPGTIVREGELALYTVLLRLTPEMAQGGVRMMVIRNAMNCRTGQIGIRAGAGYDEGGALVLSRETAPADVVYEDYPADADGHRVRRRVCGPAEG